jgi:hypothetical protein
MQGALAALAALGLGACKPTPRCPALDDCDVRKAPCQASALSQAACLRGRGEPSDTPVNVLVRDADEYIDALAEGAPTDTATATMRQGLALLGLVPSDDDLAASARLPGRLTAAYYDREADQVVLLRRPGQRLDDGAAVLLLVHEMVHVLQARAGELDAESPARFDEALAQAAVREGEATLLTDEALVSGVGLDIDHVGYDETLYYYGASQYQYTRLARAPIDELPLRFPYAEGARYLRELRADDGSYDSAAAFASPPVSTRDVLARDPSEPARYPNDLGDAAVPVLSELELVGTLHLGAYAHAVVGERYRSPWFGWGLPRVSAFRADTLAVFGDADGGVVVSWRIRYDDPSTAEAAGEAIANLLVSASAADRHLRVSVVDGALWLVIASSAELLGRIPEAPAFAAAPEADFDLTGEGAESLRCMAGSE